MVSEIFSPVRLRPPRPTKAARRGKDGLAAKQLAGGLRAIAHFVLDPRAFHARVPRPHSLPARLSNFLLPSPYQQRNPPRLTTSLSPLAQRAEKSCATDDISFSPRPVSGRGVGGEGLPSDKLVLTETRPCFAYSFLAWGEGPSLSHRLLLPSPYQQRNPPRLTTPLAPLTPGDGKACSQNIPANLSGVLLSTLGGEVLFRARPPLDVGKDPWVTLLNSILFLHLRNISDWRTSGAKLRARTYRRRPTTVEPVSSPTALKGPFLRYPKEASRPLTTPLWWVQNFGNFFGILSISFQAPSVPVIIGAR